LEQNLATFGGQQKLILEKNLKMFFFQKHFCGPPKVTILLCKTNPFEPYACLAGTFVPEKTIGKHDYINSVKTVHELDHYHHQI
jgi:hypothetical protein